MLSLEKKKEAKVKLAVLVCFSAATFIHLLPLSLHPTDSVWEPIDSILNTWIISWVHQNMLKNPLSIFEANVFFPNPGSLSYSEHLFPLAALSWPVYIVFKNPILSYNFLLFLFFTLNGYTMFLLIKRLTGNTWAGIAGGFMFAFNSYQMQHITHLQLQSSWLIPLVFLYVHEYFERKRLKDALLFAFLIFLLALSSIYYGLFLVSILILILPLFLLAYYKKITVSFLLKLFIPLSVFGLLLLIFSRPYFFLFNKFEFQRGMTQGTDVTNYFAAFSENRVLGRLLSPLGQPEFFLFPGVLAVLFAGLWIFKKRAVFRFPPLFLKTALWLIIGLSLLIMGAILLTKGFELRWGALHISGHNLAKPSFLFLSMLALLVFVSFVFTILKNKPLLEDNHNLFIYLLGLFWAFFLSFGGYFSFLGHSASDLPLPFRWFYNVLPGFKGIRMPSRYAVFVIFSLVVLAGYGLKFILSKIRKRALGIAFSLTVIALLNVEYLTLPQQRQAFPTTQDIPPTYEWLRQQPGDFSIMEVPLRSNIGWDAMCMYFSLFHHKKIVNGYSGFIPPSTIYIRQVCQVFPSVASVDILRALGVKYVIFHANQGRPEKNEKSLYAIGTKFWDALRPVAKFQYRLKETNDATAGLGSDIIYEVIPSAPKDNRPSLLQEIPLSDWSVDSDKNREGLSSLRDGRLDTAWSTNRPKSAGQFLLVEFKKPEQVKKVSLLLERFSLDYAIDLDAYVSENGTNWKVLARGYSAGEFAWNLLREPRWPVQNLTLEGSPIRYLKIVNLRDDPVFFWSVAELKIYK
ncbi:MAG TPA: discoidin domain-containing protein [Acidobacteriota bacterium]